HHAPAYLHPAHVPPPPSPAHPAHSRPPLIARPRVHSIRLKPENGWVIDLGDIPDAVAEQAKILFFNYPSNPTGATAPREFFEEVVKFAHRYQILLVHDLCYAELAFDGYQPTSLLEIPGGKEIGVEFHTMSKTYNMAGWRVGFVVGNSQVIQGLRTLKTNLDYGLFGALQTAAETALNLPDSYLTEVQNRYRTRRDFLIQGLAELGWQVPKPLATMYLWVPCPPGIGSTDFALSVLQQTGVVVTPGNAFGTGGEGYVRVSLIADCDRLAEALQRLKAANICYQEQPVPASVS
ncbi:MAG: aminotransferase class I/II-fold pyridoxal phosphate-dependent enzyme, partial [Microcoleaceae cyanobacterium]